VGLPEQAEGKGEVAGADLLRAMVEGLHVARHLPHLVHRGSRHAVGLEAEEVGEGGLRPLDRAGKDRLLPDVHIEQPVRFKGP